MGPKSSDRCPQRRREDHVKTEASLQRQCMPEDASSHQKVGERHGWGECQHLDCRLLVVLRHQVVVIYEAAPGNEYRGHGQEYGLYSKCSGK